MKVNKKVLGILFALLAVAGVIATASAVDLGDDFKIDGVGMKISSGDNFVEIANISTEDINMVVYENSDKGATDANSIIYFNDQTADKKEMASFINDLEKTANKAEETDKYVVLKNTQHSKDIDISEGFDSIFNFIGSAFSPEGINVSADGNSFSLSSDGLKVSDANGENVSITSQGISVSGESYSQASSGNVSVNVSSDVNSNINDCDYSLYMKNNDNSKVIVISGNNLALLKSMAETVKFNEN